jgi:hypothetical protein
MKNISKNKALFIMITILGAMVLSLSSCTPRLGCPGGITKAPTTVIDKQG